MPWGDPLPGGCSQPRMLLPGVKLVFSYRIVYATYALDFVLPALYGHSYTVVSPLLRPPGATSALLVRGIG